MRRSAFFVASVLLLLSSLATTQRRATAAKPDASGSYKLIAVKGTGSARYTDKEILAASGLHLGQPASEPDFRDAAQQLLHSGMFTDVAYTFSYSEAGIKVEFQLTDVDKTKLIPAYFENFIGITDSDLRDAVRQRVPQFSGSLPSSGQLTDQVTHALQGLLEERHLPGQVDYLHEGEGEDKPPTSIIFRVHGFTARVHSVEFPGATNDQTVFLTNAAHRMIDTTYSSPMVKKDIHDDLLPLLLERGYLKATFGSPETRVLPQTQSTGSQGDDQSSDEIEVDLILPVTAGRQYSVSVVDWKGNSAIPMKEAASLFHLAPGQLADAAGLEHDVENLTNLYRSRGFMTARINAEPVINETTGTVRYKIVVAEGDVYTMGELEFLGIDNASKGRLTDAWKLREGQPYNPDYTRKFLDEAPQFLPKGLQYTTKLSEDLDAKAKVVDVTIRFKTD